MWYPEAPPSVVRGLSLLLTLSLLLAGCGGGVTGLTQPPRPSFEAISDELARMEDQDLLHGGNGDPVTFNALEARRLTFSEPAISLTQELVTFTNDLIANTPRETGRREVARADVDLRRYPLVAGFFDDATRYNNTPSSTVGPSLHNPRRAPYECGWYRHPLPTRTDYLRLRLRQQTSDDPAGTLRSWQYHPTPDRVLGIPHGGGWTREQTYNAEFCHTGSFRDQAWIEPDGRTITEQNYEGFSPRGEPNVEWWRYFWPYIGWPAYVYWWHHAIGTGQPLPPQPQPPAPPPPPLPPPPPPPLPPPPPPPGGLHYSVWRGGTETINRGGAWAAQRFVARFQTITRVSFNAGGPSNGPWANSATVFIYSDESMTARVAAVFVPDINDYGETVVLFPGPVAVTIGRAYWVQVHTGQPNVRILLFASRFGADYPDGCSYWHDFNASTVMDCAVDLNMRIQ